MTKLSRAEREHNRGIEKLVIKLLDKNYDAVLMNPVYHVDDSMGELDVLAIRGDYAHYYEVKCHKSKGTVSCAKKQLHRVQEAFPNWNVKGIYVPLDGSPKRIK